jgi:hypothetical protein
MVVKDDAVHLVLAGEALSWSPAAYGAACPLPGGEVTVLTPAPMVAVMRAGWKPVLHATALAAAESP